MIPTRSSAKHPTAEAEWNMKASEQPLTPQLTPAILLNLENTQSWSRIGREIEE